MTRERLRKLAKAAIDFYEDDEYVAAASPAVVLGLLDDLAAAESEVARQEAGRDVERNMLWAAVPKLERLAEVEERLAAGRALHWPQPYADADLREVSPSLPKDVCAHCRSTGDGAVPWPCPTIRALDGRADS